MFSVLKQMEFNQSISKKIPNTFDVEYRLTKCVNAREIACLMNAYN